MSGVASFSGGYGHTRMQPGRGRGGSGQEIRDSQWPLAKAGSFRLHQPSTFTAIRLADRGACDPERVFHIPLTQWRLMLPRPVTDLKPLFRREMRNFRRGFTPILVSSTGALNRLQSCRSARIAFCCRFFVAEHAGNFMMSMAVDDADAWWEYIQKQELSYP